jgi:serine/threonine-protein kinase
MGPDQRASASDCPDREALAAFSRGRLPDEPLEIIAEHISACPRCATLLEELQKEDTILSHLRRPSSDSPVVDEAICLRLAEQACAIGEAVPLQSTLPDARSTEVATGPPLPAIFGPYLLLECLGHGGMGVVFKARQETLKRLVAVKMIRAGMYASAEERLRFRREGESIARIRHAHVVQIHEFGEHAGQLYFSMELLEGGTLAGRLRDGPMPESDAAELVRTLAQAVAAAHAQGIVHRDLKPGNVLLAADGSVKITDFGLAKLLNEDSNVTCTDAILGTPAYMAPEQARGERQQIGPATDVYALGAILYEALTGHAPFHGESRSQTLEQVRDREPEPPSRRRPGLARDLEAICLKCLEKEPGRRYPSAAELAEDVDRWLRGEPTLVRPPGWLIRLRRHLRRRPGWTFAAALLLFVAIALPAGLWYRDPERPIRAIESGLARRRAQTLIGERGRPRWSYWHVGRGTPQMSVLADGTFGVQSWTAALLELVRDPQCSHYQLRAEVRHETSANQAEVGIFVAHCIHSHPTRPVHQFVVLTFNDIEREKDLYDRKAATIPRPFRPPPPKGNPVKLDPHLYAEREPEPWHVRNACGPRHYFEPVGYGGRDWRELMVEVTPEGVKGFWGGRAFGELRGSQLVESLNNYLAWVRKNQPDEPFAYRLDPTYAPRGGLGLYVRNGSASFRNVVIEPLEDPN